MHRTVRISLIVAAIVAVAVAVFFFIKKFLKMPVNMLSLSDNGRREIIKHEGFRTQAYKDVAGLWTIGIGHLIQPNEQHLITATLTEKEVYEIFKADIARFEKAIRELVKVRITQNMYDALISLVFNIGEAAFAKSTLLRKLNEGAPKEEVAAEFLKWNKAGGQVVAGLTKRRESEKKLFLS
jgi:lysozyme